MLLWQLTLILLYIVWSIFAIKTIIKRREDKLTFGKYINHSIANTPINYIFWAIKVQAIIIDNKELELHLYKRKQSFDDTMRYISEMDSHWADTPMWGDDY